MSSSIGHELTCCFIAPVVDSMRLGRHLSRSIVAIDSVGLCPDVPILKTPRIVCGYECEMEYKGLTKGKWEILVSLTPVMKLRH